MGTKKTSTTPDGGLLSYKIRNNTIYHCFDPPHLIKVIRNNLETKNLKHFVTHRWKRSKNVNIHKEQFASWDHILALYSLDSGSTRRLVPKITEEHVRPSKLKMKVSVATQVFSATCAKVMLLLAEQKALPTNVCGTAEILYFFNDLFDSMNGSQTSQNETLRGSVNEHSPHFEFWEYALSMLSKMSFIEKTTGNSNNRSTILKKFQSTIRGYVEITKICMNLNMVNVAIRYQINFSKVAFVFGNCFKIFYLHQW